MPTDSSAEQEVFGPLAPRDVAAAVSRRSTA
jgi:hypothetical protein